MSKLKGYRPDKGDKAVDLVCTTRSPREGVCTVQDAEESPRDPAVPGVVESKYDEPGTGSSTIFYPAQGY